MNENFSVLISSCDKFSDLWKEHIRLYRENWQGKVVKTYLVTDKETSQTFEDVEIIVAPAECDFPMRIKHALQYIETPFVLLTLDDYFTINSIKSDNLNYLSNRAEKESIDFLMLYDRRKDDSNKYKELNILEQIDLSKKYAVTLYPAIWNKEFLSKTIKEDLSPWLYEVSLTKTAIEERAKCFYSPSGTFRILDVVRKGKVLHKADRYFKKNGINIGDRPLIGGVTEIKLAIIDRLNWYAPKWFVSLLKNVGRKFGMEFYSD
uniref:CpsK n=1 Tax=Streptococcus suis TaxID=1307 RepID=A0A1P8VS68_STRSU|nr:cpsK [Streptococcus suis]